MEETRLAFQTESDYNPFDDDGLENLDIAQLDITSQEDYILDEAAGHIQENLEDELVQEALRKGWDLRKYSQQIQKDLMKVETHSIEDYIGQSTEIARLHYQIKACDTILERMEGMLSKFQMDLGNISSEIQTLQEQSVSLNSKLKNRQDILDDLSQYVDDINLTDHLITHILETPASEKEFQENLHELDHKLNFIKEQEFREIAAVVDVQKDIIKLKMKAISKTREFLLSKIYQFRKPMANYQMAQNQLLNYRYFNEFLMAHSRPTALEMQTEYVDTMSKIYYSYFKDYYSKLMKLQYDDSADKDDLMGIEDTARRSFFSSKVSLRNRSTTFTLGSRDTVITTGLESPIIVIPHAQKNEKKYSYEQLFRSVHYALMDNACREYLFIADFFSLTSAAAQEMFDSIFTKTQAFLLKHTESYMESCFDTIGIFLCIHINFRYQAIMQRRNLTCLEIFSDHLLAVMWPRFHHVVELNIKSVRDCNTQKLGTIDTRPHYITRRYAEFSAALVSINSSQQDEKVTTCLAALQAEVESFILRMAAEFQQRKEQLIFLINNYDMLLSVLAEHTSEGSKEVVSFQGLLNARTQEYIEEVLAPFFGGMISFVKDNEGYLERGETRKINVNEKHIHQIVKGFSSDWKKALDLINQDIMRTFTNFKNGTAILQGALMQLIQYYHRFTKLLSQSPFKELGVKGDLINIHHVMVEVKKYRANF
ncbi:vacuolar protein sorting-associated protein 52 homolog isoform X2 [Dysidea avara]|uniref:vacuolar protein sorting-associated protein 52 homolog isoform X2 n=1 Tax=Dysidea avara TaxID=196820 RepID=UPI003325AE7D